MTEKLGVVCGYAALFNEPSLDLAEKGEAPWYELIRPGGLELASNVMLDRHHLDFMPVASTKTRTLRCGFDETGLWFEADLYPQSGGYDVLGGLRGGRALATSFTMVERRAERRGNVETVVSAMVVSLTLLKAGRAVYSRTRAWLADEMPRDTVAAELQSLRLRAGARLIAAARRAPPASQRGWNAHHPTERQCACDACVVNFGRAARWDQAAAKRLGVL